MAESVTLDTGHTQRSAGQTSWMRQPHSASARQLWFTPHILTPWQGDWAGALKDFELAEESFDLCDSDLLGSVDNVGLLLLDSIWCGRQTCQSAKLFPAHALTKGPSCTHGQRDHVEARVSKCTAGTSVVQVPVQAAGQWAAGGGSRQAAARPHLPRGLAWRLPGAPARAARRLPAGARHVRHFFAAKLIVGTDAK